MPGCEICGNIQHRRVRNRSTDKLVCYSCNLLLNNPFWAVKDLRKAESIIDKYSKEFKIKTPNIRYKFNSPFSAIPPVHVLENAVYGLDVDGYYHEFSKPLADFYGIEYPKYYKNKEKVPKNAIACYYSSTNEVYSKDGINQHTAFHEMWHALENFGIVPYDPKTSERDADRYATGCVTRLETKLRTGD